MKNRISALTLIFLMGVMLLVTAVFFPRYKLGGGNATLAWDGAGYYWYLPSLFIYHDLGGQRWADSVITRYQPGPSPEEGFGPRVENGNRVMKYASGLAVMEAPFFFAGHLAAKSLGYPADGFSLPYQMAIQYGALLVSFIGLWAMRRLLLRYFPDRITALCLFLLVIGTNFLNYAAIDGSVSHCWLFTVYALLMLCTASFYWSPGYGKAAWIGLLCGLAILTRPTEIVCALIPLLWGIDGREALAERFSYLKRHRGKIALALFIGGAVAFIQPFYWKQVSGHWLVYSYGEQGFRWFPPHALDYTFSYRSGWLTYTPLMYFAVLGLALIIRRGPHRVMLPLVLVLAFWAVSAWNIWWYAGMGGRAMVQYYALLLFPLGAALQWTGQRKWRIAAGTPFLILFTYLNVWLTYQAHSGGLYDSEGGMTAQYFWRVVGRWKAAPQTAKLKDGKYLFEGPLPANAQLLYQNSLRSDTLAVLPMDATHEFSPQYNFAFSSNRHFTWLRAEASFYTPASEGTPWKMLQFCLEVWSGKNRLRDGMARVQRFTESGRQAQVWVELKLPEDEAFDSVKVHFWNPGSRERIEISGLKVWAF